VFLKPKTEAQTREAGRERVEKILIAYLYYFISLKKAPPLCGGLF